jgi:DNA-binding transcriptional LysR family regulator
MGFNMLISFDVVHDHRARHAVEPGRCADALHARGAWIGAHAHTSDGEIARAAHRRSNLAIGMQYNEIELLATFARVVERRSVSAAAADLGVRQSSVSRRLADLERAYGAVLLQRSSRVVVPTEAGGRLYHTALTVIRQLEAARRDVTEERGSLTGSIRLTSSAAIGVLHLAPLVFAFQQQHLRLRLHLSVSDLRADLLGDGFDLAIRVGHPGNGEERLRPLGQSRRLLVASREYLSQHGAPRTPAALAPHRFVRLAQLDGGDRLTLQDRSGRSVEVHLADLFTTDSALVLREGLRLGQCMGYAHEWLVADLLARGDLVRVLSSYELSSVPINLLIAPGRSELQRIRLFAAFLADAIPKLPGISRA